LLTSAAAAGVDADLERAILEMRASVARRISRKGWRRSLKKGSQCGAAIQIELSFDTLAAQEIIRTSE